MPVLDKAAHSSRAEVGVGGMGVVAGYVMSIMEVVIVCSDDS